MDRSRSRSREANFHPWRPARSRAFCRALEEVRREAASLRAHHQPQAPRPQGARPRGTVLLQLNYRRFLEFWRERTGKSGGELLRVLRLLCWTPDEIERLLSWLDS